MFAAFQSASTVNFRYVFTAVLKGDKILSLVSHEMFGPAHNLGAINALLSCRIENECWSLTFDELGALKPTLTSLLMQKDIVHQSRWLA